MSYPELNQPKTPETGAADAYDEQSFWDKASTVAKSAGREVIEKALWLYYAAQRPEVPLKVKATIYGALGYFILPIDAIPDIVPMLGYGDDLTALAAAIALASQYIDDNVKRLASLKMLAWFKD